MGMVVKVDGVAFDFDADTMLLLRYRCLGF